MQVKLASVTEGNRTLMSGSTIRRSAVELRPQRRLRDSNSQISTITRFRDGRATNYPKTAFTNKKTSSDHEIRKGHLTQTYIASDYDINSPDFMRTLTNHLII